MSKYHKGCGPEVLTVSGYTGSETCGVDMSATGANVVTFGCFVNPTEVRVNNVGAWSG